MAELAAWVSVVCALVALVVSGYVARSTHRSRELDVFDRAYRRVVELEEKFLEKSAGGTTPSEALAWRVSFLNALEYFALLINERHINDPQLMEYLRPSILHWYERIFLSSAEGSDIRDPRIYPELKRLYVFWHSVSQA
jgi:hypothetical protein